MSDRTPALTHARHALILTYHYPPMVGAPSSRAAALARHLPGTGWNPIFVTPRSAVVHRDRREAKPSARVVRTANPGITEALHSLRRLRRRSAQPAITEVAAISDHPIAPRMRRAAHEWLYVPDGQVGWIPFAAIALQRVLRSLPGSAVVLSSSVP